MKFELYGVRCKSVIVFSNANKTRRPNILSEVELYSSHNLSISEQGIFLYTHVNITRLRKHTR